MDNQEGGFYYEYKLISQDSKFYYIYTASQVEKIDSIGLFSKDHIDCYED
ncbi:hypothetical protein F942_00550 [Acinetobacter ursingii ANC 3649]|uniref:Uncharacterized protein n=1 Tax=Acinetobacter ursingii ANC 3649 TaxID=1257043 RepID=N9DJS9_9GAMM|nr:hypothetical protein F942_00550 [Acinetobacter ursingii ANC 3649]